jgi:hypothetical protein
VPDAVEEVLEDRSAGGRARPIEANHLRLAVAGRLERRVSASGEAGVLVTIFAPALHPVLELPLHLVERSVGRLARVVEESVLGRSMADKNLVTRKAKVDPDAVTLTSASMVTSELDHDVARDDAVEQALKLLGSAIDVERERVGVRDAPERELNWHGKASAYFARKVRARRSDP